ncbi:transposase [Lebetimonas sp. JH292]|uniref:transposase n=1 Tax=Lebetimonas sp. JH292 TaxID=990068 RepID=UPI0004B89033|nr:transposase [Lebetimonas sp. JH292]
MQIKKTLPHINLKGYYQFVTFRTQDSLDSYIRKIRAQNIENKKQEYLIDKYLDNSLKGAYLNDEIFEFLKDFLINLDKIFYELIAFTIMPNHIHLLFKQIKDLDIIIKKIKGESAYRINKMLNKSGKFWEKNYYDKVIRNEEHFNIVYNYIKFNGFKAGLKDWKERFYGVYE